ncbi:MAG: ABC transporter substrate-binding protein [Phycisphaerae bacterium]|nr:ABC transporter substrate-binding protein [Phycisphaerae bacterium]
MVNLLHSRRMILVCAGLVALTGMILVLVFGPSPTTRQPIKIGLATTLSGPASTTGVHARNGAMLAVEEVSAKGGVRGRPVELVIKDDKADTEEALRVDQALIDEGVVAILGHYLSTLAVATVPLMNERGILMIGLGSITSALTGLDDQFMRVEIPVDREAPMMAALAYDRLGLRDMVVVYDASNPKIADSWYTHFGKEFGNRGGRVSDVVSFDSRKSFSAPDLARSIIKTRAEGMFLVTSGMHGALICQHLRRLGSTITVVASGWTFPSPDFLSNGGLAVEGTVSVSGFEEVPSSKRAVAFRQAYERRFGTKPTEPSQNGYEAAHILLEALAVTDDPGRLKEIILKKKVFQGIGGQIVFDEYGDPIRPAYIVEIRNRHIATLGKAEPAKP